MPREFCPRRKKSRTFWPINPADKRAKLIDRLLERDEYVDYWAYKWSDLMLISSRKLRANAMWSFYNWIRDSVKEDKPWNKFAYEIFTSSGDTRQNGALNYYVLHKDPIDLTETATEAFMGNRVTCARCHNHPLEKWTQKQYYELVNLFARVGLKNGNEPGDIVVYAKATGDVLHPKLLKPLPPTPLDGTPMSLDATDDRRVHFADWLISPAEHLFRALAGEPRVGEFHGPRPGGIGGRCARHQSGFERGAVRRAERRFREERLRREAADPHHHEFRRLPAFRGFERGQPDGHEILFALFRKAAAGGSAAGRHVAGDRRAHEVRRVSGGHARAAIAGRAGAVAIPERVRPAEAHHLRCGRAVERAEHRAGAACDQRRHAEQEAERRERLCGAGGEAGAFGFAHSGQLFLSAFSRYPSEAEKQPLLDALRKAPRRGTGRRTCSAKRIARRWKT
jgi:hypothetical protein